MSYLGSKVIDNNLTFYVQVRDPVTKLPVAADAAPTYRVYKQETATPILTGTMATLDAGNTTGYYSEQIALTGANGFEIGKDYSVRIVWAVSLANDAEEHNWQMGMEVSSLSADVITATAIQDNAITAAKIATGAIDAYALADDAVTEIRASLIDFDLLGYAPTVGSVADYWQRIASRATQTSVDDIPTNAEFTARTLAAASYATAANQSTILTNIATIDNIVDAIVLDTNELQTDWANNGRLDLILDARASQTDVTTLLDRLTSARAGYLDNLNVGGVVASQADINALNQSASRRIILTTVGQYERPESGSSEYTVEARTYDGDGAAVNADSTPLLAVNGSITGGGPGANLSAATNPVTGVYRWTYTVEDDATVEQIRYDISATMGTVFTLSAYTQVVNFVAATWTSTDASNLTAIFNKLPSKSFLAGTINSDGDLQLDEATGALQSLATDAISAASVSAGAVTKIQTGLSTLTEANIRTAVGLTSNNLDTQLSNIQTQVNTNGDALTTIAQDTTTDIPALISALAGDVTSIKMVTDKVDDTLEDSGGGAWIFTEEALANAPTGGSAPTVQDIVDGMLLVADDFKADVSNLALQSTSLAIAGGVVTVIASVGNVQTRLPAALVNGRMESNVAAINNIPNAAVRLSLSATQIIPGTIDDGGFTPTTTLFQSDDITEATANHYNDRLIIFTSGALAGQATSIEDYQLSGGRGQFSVVALTEAPANNDTFIII